MFRHAVHVVGERHGCGSDVAVLYKESVAIVESRRKRLDMAANSGQVLGLAGEYDPALCIVAVVQRTDADRVTGGDERM